MIRTACTSGQSCWLLLGTLQQSCRNLVEQSCQNLGQLGQGCAEVWSLAEPWKNLAGQSCGNLAGTLEQTVGILNLEAKWANRPHWTQVVAYHCLSVLCGGKGTAPGCAPRGSPKVPSGQSCRQLRIVKLPATVVGISDNAFRSCKLLNSVTAPGCREFGYKAFDECCSLQWVYTAEGVANQFSSTTKFGHYLFRGCINLAEFTLRETPSPSELPSQTTASDLALGCLSSTGITTLTLTQGFTVIGAHACDNCHLLKKVDLSNTQIEEIQEFTFVHCTSLKEVSLPMTLHTIRAKAFMNCAALPELAIPPSLKYIASRAFLDCTAFRRLVKLPGRHKWRGVYAEENAFAICPDMRWPPWLHMIPDTGCVSGLA